MSSPPGLVYRLDARASASHRLGVVLEIDRTALPEPDAPLELFLPVWTPGSYLVREYQRHLEGLRAEDASSGAELTVRKAAKNRFRIGGEASRVRVHYQVYAHELTVRTADLTAEHAFWNGACVCLWPVGGEEVMAELAVELPHGWRCVTQLPAIDEAAHRYRAAGLDAVVDAPFLAAGDVMELSFEICERRHRVLLDGLAGLTPPATLLDDTRRVVEEAAAVFGGELPYSHYDFMVMMADRGRGGLEHQACSVLLAPRTTFAIRRDYEDFLGLIAHEFFHVWNVKRMRPASLWRYDYERENHTTLLWVAEGITAYYDDLLCLRAGVLSRDRYLEIVADTVTAMHRTPGRLLQSLSAASFDAWIKLYRPDENSRNSTQSYYSHGALAALCFDLHIRAVTDGARSLDDALARLYRTTYGQGRGYRRTDVVAALSDTAGQDMAGRIEALVDGPFDPPMAETLQPFGLRLVPKPNEGPELGIQFRSDGLVVSSVVRGGAASDAGVSPGDELLAIDGLRVLRDSWASVLRACWQPDRPLRLLASRRGRIVDLKVPVQAPTAESWRIEVDADATPEQIRLRTGWLGS